MISQLFISRKGFHLPLFPLLSCMGILLFQTAFSVFAEPANPAAEEQKASPIPTISLTLDQTIQTALQNNKQILAARYRAESRQYDLISARSEFEVKITPLSSMMYGGGNVSGGDNSLNLGLSMQKKLEMGTNLYLSPTINKTDQQYNNSLGLTIEQPLFKGFGREVTLSNVRSAEFAQHTANRNILQTQTNISLEAINAFYQVIKQKKIYQLSASAGQKLKGHSAIAQAKEKVGLATPMDTYRAEINLKELENSATQAKEAMQDALDRLKIILALPLQTPVSLIQPLPVGLKSMKLFEAIETALDNRIEITQARAELEEADRKSEVLKNQTLPGLKLVLNAGQYAATYNLGQTSSIYQNNWSIMLQGTTDLRRTAEKAAYQQSLLTIKMLRLDLENRRDEIDKQVRKQWTALKENENRIRIRKEQIRQAEEKLALAEVKYAHDMANNFDIIEAETELQKARVMLLSEEIEHAVGTYNFKAVLGILLPKSRPKDI